MRAFAFEEMRYFNFEAQLSLRQVEEEIKAIRIVLTKALGESGYEDTAAGSGLIYLGAPSGSSKVCCSGFTECTCASIGRIIVATGAWVRTRTAVKLTSQIV